MTARRLLLDIDANSFFVIGDFDDFEAHDRAGAAALAAALAALDLVLADAEVVA